MLSLLRFGAPWLMLGAATTLLFCGNGWGFPLAGLAILWLVIRVYPT